MGINKATGTVATGGRERGFSLIELMVVVAIAAVLISVAIPSYRDYVRRGAIEEATSQLSAGRVVFEQFFLDNRTYDGSYLTPSFFFTRSARSSASGNTRAYSLYSTCA